MAPEQTAENLEKLADSWQMYQLLGLQLHRSKETKLAKVLV